jgi:lambda repressor-like predicted transcriptional regulator
MSTIISCLDKGAKKMTPNEIRAELKRRGINQADIAPLVRPRPVKPSTVRVVISGCQRSRPIQEAVAEVLGIPYEKIWGKAA